MINNIAKGDTDIRDKISFRLWYACVSNEEFLILFICTLQYSGYFILSTFLLIIF